MKSALDALCDDARADAGGEGDERTNEGAPPFVRATGDLAEFSGASPARSTAHESPAAMQREAIGERADLSEGVARALPGATPR
jgi:hypothetical protein